MLTIMCYILAAVVWVFYSAGLTKGILDARKDPASIEIKEKKTPEEILFKTNEKDDGTLEYVEVKKHEKNVAEKKMLSPRDAGLIAARKFVMRHTLTAVFATFFFIALGRFFDAGATLMINTYKIAADKQENADPPA